MSLAASRSDMLISWLVHCLQWTWTVDWAVDGCGWLWVAVGGCGEEISEQ